MIREKEKFKRQNLKKNKAPRIIAGIVAACVCMGLVFVQKTTSSTKKYAGQTLHVYNAGEYTGENCFLILKNKRDAK